MSPGRGGQEMALSPGRWGQDMAVSLGRGHPRVETHEDVQPILNLRYSRSICNLQSPHLKCSWFLEGAQGRCAVDKHVLCPSSPS
jgi:hypothetical protein